MRRKIEKLMKELPSMHFTDNPVNVDYDYKYFVCYDNTYSVVLKANTLQDMYYKIVSLLEGFKEEEEAYNRGLETN